jgi:hypothetical protein
MIKPVLAVLFLSSSLAAGRAPEPAPGTSLSSLASPTVACPAPPEALAPLEPGVQVSDFICGQGYWWHCGPDWDGGWSCRCERLGGNPT